MTTRFFQDDDVIILTRKGSFSQWPMILKPLQSTFSFDPWEVLPGEVTINENTPLGSGCFGEVYKGVRPLWAGPKRGARSPRFSLTTTVAVKRLKSEFLCLSRG